MGRKRLVTADDAWCNKGQHMVPHAGFAKGQVTCRECRRIHYNKRCNYSQGKTCKDCASPIANTSTARCAKCRAIYQRKAPEDGARYINAHGYAELRSQHQHPNADRRGIVLEHVKVMSETLGRALRPGENVHHINGVRDDNRPENLELWVISQPSGQRPTDLVAWAREILDRYAAECV